jgi:hypothetical protein
MGQAEKDNLGGVVDVAEFLRVTRRLVKSGCEAEAVELIYLALDVVERGQGQKRLAELVERWREKLARLKNPRCEVPVIGMFRR